MSDAWTCPAAVGIALLCSRPELGAGLFAEPLWLTGDGSTATLGYLGCRLHLFADCAAVSPQDDRVDPATLPERMAARHAPAEGSSGDLIWCRLCLSRNGVATVCDLWLKLALLVGHLEGARARLVQVTAQAGQGRDWAHLSRAELLEEPVRSLTELVTDLGAHPCADGAGLAHHLRAATEALATVERRAALATVAGRPATHVAVAGRVLHWAADELAALRPQCAALAERWPRPRLLPPRMDGSYPSARTALVLVERGCAKAVHAAASPVTRLRQSLLLTAPLRAASDDLAVVELPADAEQFLRAGTGVRAIVRMREPLPRDTARVALASVLAADPNPTPAAFGAAVRAAAVALA